jgi:hypothetical protein
MNERIKQLAEQATSIVEMVGPQGYTSSYANFNREKFAELIVKECAEVCFKIDGEYDGEEVLATWCGAGILEHFGMNDE